MARNNHVGDLRAGCAIDELKTRASLKNLSEFELDILYSRAKTRLWEKMERLRGVPKLSVSDFGTRRELAFSGGYVVIAMRDVLGSNFCRQLQHLPVVQALILKPSAPMPTSCPWR